MQARGVCDEVRRLYQEASQGLRIHVDTAWGPSEEVTCDRGVLQGAVSPELSIVPTAGKKQCLLHHLCWPMGGSGCLCGRRPALTRGARQLPQLLRDLRDGSMLTGVGDAWDKFSVLCTDWEDMLDSQEGEAIGLTAEGVQASGLAAHAAKPSRVPGRTTPRNSRVRGEPLTTATLWRLRICKTS